MPANLVVLLGTSDIATAQLADFTPEYRVTIDVQRFDSIQGQGFDPLAAAHSQALAKMSADIAAAIRAEAEQR